MWKLLSAVVAAAIVFCAGLAFYLSDKIYLRFDHVELSPDELGRPFGAEELRADFTFATQTIERIHPDFWSIVDRSAYEQAKADLLAEIGRPMTRAEFYQVISRLNESLGDGHTGIGRPAEEWRAVSETLRIPPIAIRLEGGGIFIDRAFGEKNIPAGSRLIAINDIPAEEIAASLMARESGEGAVVRRAFAARGLPEEIFLRSMTPPFHIAYSSPDGAGHLAVTEAGVSLADWKTKAEQRAPTEKRSLTIEGATAVLFLRDFEQPQREYEEFLKSAFTRIKDAGVTSLILDLRENTGGDSRQGDQLQSYLSDDVLPALDSVSVHATPEIKRIYRTLLPEGFRWIPLNSAIPFLRGIQEAEDGGFYTFRPGSERPRERRFKNQLAFKGDLYVLTGPRTYSAAAIFVGPLKHWKRATLVGQPTGEPMTFYGDLYEFDLPNTHLVATVSHKTFRLFGSRGPREGITPDIDVAVSDELDAAREEIARREAH